MAVSRLARGDYGNSVVADYNHNSVEVVTGCRYCNHLQQEVHRNFGDLHSLVEAHILARRRHHHRDHIHQEPDSGEVG